MDWAELYVSLSGSCSSLTLHNYCCFVAISNNGQKMSNVTVVFFKSLNSHSLKNTEYYVVKSCVVLSFCQDIDYNGFNFFQTALEVNYDRGSCFRQK